MPAIFALIYKLDARDCRCLMTCIIVDVISSNLIARLSHACRVKTLYQSSQNDSVGVALERILKVQDRPFEQEWCIYTFYVNVLLPWCCR